jgi:hypothetical protein
MRNPPDVGTPSPDRDPDTCVPMWYCAYFGTYKVDYHINIWVTHVLGGNIPNHIEGLLKSNSASSGKFQHVHRA